MGNFAKVSKGEEILQTAVPLIEQIDELFFGKLDNNEEQFKHFLVRLNKNKNIIYGVVNFDSSILHLKLKNRA
ncbi:hypothetical protein NEISICOT_02705 [Neisseria sicca ATCC 29256]|uniref:Uncharacterized protein n=1 Tax=Neisseria sicca ATCC 29256 TaxID=547045 RepID=C6M840_NEISI|nr:hypothetical protein NEISICOT_02705 [Neisseria sicca ATCC 29256]